MDFLKRINWLMVLAYFFLTMAVMGLIIYVTEFLFDMNNPGLAIMSMFAILGSIAYAFYLMGEGRGWKWLAYFQGFMAAFCLWLWLMVEDIVHPAIGLSSMFFIMAGAVMYIAHQRKLNRAERIEGGNFRELGTSERLEYLTPSQRDHAPAKRDRDYEAR